MIGELLPRGVHSAESRSDIPAVLPAIEEALIARAVERRRREFTTTRELARTALRSLGHPPVAVPSGIRGAPVWPAGVVGSMTHCTGYRAAVVARDSVLAAVGIDAEPDGPLPGGILETISSRPERAALIPAAADPGRLLFSAKESVYKAWYPLTGRPLGFTDAEVTFEPSGVFTARLLVPGPSVGGRELDVFDGRWLTRGGLVLTAVTIPVQ